MSRASNLNVKKISKLTNYSAEAKEILTNFFGVLARQVKLAGTISDETENELLRQQLAYLFGEGYRDIVTAETVAQFIIPGSFLSNKGLHPVKPGTLDQHRLLKGTVVLVRIDERAPDIVEVETIEGDDELNRMFRLTTTEYKTIVEKLREINPCETLNRLLPPGKNYMD